MAAKALGDKVLETVGRSRNAIAAAIDLATARLALFHFAELFFELGKTVGSQSAGMIDVAELSCASRSRTTENRGRLALFGPNG